MVLAFGFGSGWEICLGLVRVRARAGVRVGVKAGFRVRVWVRIYRLLFSVFLLIHKHTFIFTP